MKLTMRRYQEEDDYWHIRDFLRQVFLRNDRRELCWQAYRFDYWRWHGIENLGQGPLEETVFIWETPEGQMAAVLNPENTGVVFLQVHPAFRTPGLEEEMIAVAEQNLTRPQPSGERKLWVFANERDDVRQGILLRRGFTLRDIQENQNRQSLLAPIPAAPLAEGYVVRPLGDVDELPARSWVSWKAFHPDAPDERYEGWEWYHNIQRCPLYRRDLDIVAVASTGEFAAFCTVWFDDVTRTGSFEPVGVHPDHQRRGLGRTVMYEGLRRLKKLGATLACVGSEAPNAFAFYTSIGFESRDVARPWAKEWRADDVKRIRKGRK